MTGFSGYSRDELRRSYMQAWRKHIERELLTPLEASIADVIELHPEYHALVADERSATGFGLSAGDDRENPYLHMGLHLAVREQIAVDRPPGIRDLHRLLLAEQGDAHAAEHALMEALGETLWEAQRRGVAPDERLYLARARRVLGD